jgi:putative tryptophan/tyrosine transport system substrate-binding protein
MRRRDFISFLGGTAIAWPRIARAQRQNTAPRRIGVLMALAVDDPEAGTRMAVFRQGLQEAGWTDGGNLHIEIRWSAGNKIEARKSAEELVALGSEVVLANGNAAVAPLLEVTRSVPIVFTVVPDPVGAGFVESLARPGGNATGFVAFEYGLSTKWLELLKEIMPGVAHAAVIQDPLLASGAGQLAALQSVAPSLGVELSPIIMHEPFELEDAVAAYARLPNAGLIVTASALAAIHRDLIVSLATKYKLPAVYFARHFAYAGGLISYGPDFVDQFRRAAVYVDRILRGEKPSGLPVQTPTKYEMIVNLKTAKALGMEIPSTVIARAEEVIE